MRQQADHQSELDKRDILIAKLESLFKEVEGKQALREKEHENKINQMVTRLEKKISNLKTQLTETEEENIQL